jgi:rhodanese-related sulfurtransferase
MEIIRLAWGKRQLGIIKKALEKFFDGTGDDWNYILPEELNKKKKSPKLFLLDTRDPESFKKGHIEGATNIFWKDILEEKNLEKLPRNKRIIVICYVGHTASQVMVALRLLGYKATALKFGMGISPVKAVPVAGWTDFGFDTVKGK